MIKRLSILVLVLLGVTLLSACNKKPVEEVKDETAPMIVGVMDTTIDVGDTFNPLQGVSATDDTDGNITSSIVVTGTYDVNVAGTYTLTYTVKDAAGNQKVATRKLIVLEASTSDLRIVNGDFSQPLSGSWTHWAGNGGESTATIVDGVAVIDIKANGSDWYSTQFNQPGLTLTQGKMYRLEFEAKADIARGIIIKIENVAYEGYLDQLVELTTTMSKYTLEFFVTKSTITNGKLIVGAGTMVSKGIDAGALTKVYLDNFIATEVDPGVDDVAPVINGATAKNIEINQDFDPLAGVTVSDNRDLTLTKESIVITGDLDITTAGVYTLTYTLTDATGNVATVERIVTVLAGLVPSTLILVNGDFETEQLAPTAQPAETGWGWHGAGTFTAKIENGVAVINVMNPGTVPHGVQFYQQNKVVEQGQIYKITFDAKADMPRPIMFALEQGTTRRYDEIVFLSTEWVSYEIQIDHVLTGYTNAKFAFFLGEVGDDSIPTTVYLDNIEIETIKKQVDTSAPQLFGLSDYYIAKGSAFNPRAGITLRENFDKKLTLDDVAITGAVNTAVIGSYPLTYVVTDASGNSATYTRNIEVVEQAVMPLNTLVLINGDFAIDQPLAVPEPAATGWGWKTSGAGAFTVDISGGTAKVNVTALGTVPHGVQFFQQNRIVESGSVYRLTFKAKADIARSLRVSLEAGTAVRFFQVVDITTEWVEYEVFINPTGPSFTNGKFGLFMGYIDESSVPTTFHLDDINLELVGYKIDTVAPMILNAGDIEVDRHSTFNPISGITVFDLVDKALKPEDIVVEGTVNTSVVGTYNLTYKLTDASGNMVEVERVVTVVEGTDFSSFYVLNGDFSVDQLTPTPQQATTGWGWHGGAGGGASFTTVIKDGVAKIEVFDTFNVFYGNQFYMQQREVRQDVSYKISFRAKADSPRPLRMSLEGTGAWNAFYDLTTEWVTYTYEFTHTAATITNGKFAFFVGNMHNFSTATTVYLDDIVITKIMALSADTEVPQIWNALDTVWAQGHVFDPLYGLAVYDHIDKDLTVDDITVTGSVDHNVVGDYTLVYKLKDASGNELVLNRVIHVVLESALPTSRIVITDGDFALEKAITNLDANPGWTLKAGGSPGTWTPHEFVDGGIKIGVTNVGTVPHSIQFFQKNGFVSELGQTYLLTFKAKADVARDIRASFEESTNWSVLDYEIVALTTEWATYNVYLTNQNRSHVDVKVGLFLGLIEADKPERSAATAIYFDDVSIKLVGHAVDTVKPMIYAPTAEVVKDAVFMAMTGVKYGDFAKNPTVVVTSTTPGLVLEAAGVYSVNTANVGTFSLTYTVTDFYGNQTVFVRSIVISEAVPQA